MKASLQEAEQKPAQDKKAGSPGHTSYEAEHRACSFQVAVVGDTWRTETLSWPLMDLLTHNPC